ncbi:hypothetical protein [Sanguibacter sp. 25GB23B1]|uniref:hypothetical protein n=1 Tax=unclassified Sanguibacter TaxID=2645534 RepID=UPI0032AFFE0C
MTRDDRTTAAAPATGWEWQDGTLYRRQPRRWIPRAVLYGIQVLSLLLLPAVFLVPAIQALVDASWSWSSETCVAVSRDGDSSCGAAWAFLAIGGALLAGWIATLVAVARAIIAQHRQVATPLHLDARFLHATIPDSFLHGPARISIRWEDVLTIEHPTRGTDTLLVRLVPGAEVTARDRVARDQPLVGSGSFVTIECGEAAVDAPVLRYFLSDVSRWGLATQAGAEHGLRVAGV